MRQHSISLSEFAVKASWQASRISRLAFGDSTRAQRDSEMIELCSPGSTPCDAAPVDPLSECDLERLLFCEGPLEEWNEDAELMSALALPQMTGGVNAADQRTIYFLVRGLHPGIILKIGTHIGCSAVV